MKILIGNKSFQDVGHIILQIGDAGYRIMVKETSCSFNINPLFIAPERSSVVKEARRQSVIHDDIVAAEDEEGKKVGGDVNRLNSGNSEGILPHSSSPSKARNPIHGEGGIVNLDVELAVGDDVERSYWRGDANMEVEQVRVEVDKSPVFQINLNMIEGVDRPVDSPVVSSNSHSRTRTACFSQNGYSEEFIKITNQLGTFKGNEGNEGSLINDVVIPSRLGSSNDGSAHDGPHTKGLNVDALDVDEVQSQQASDNLVHPPGFEPCLSPSIANSDESSIPPGFEVTTKGKVSSVQRGINSKSHIDFVRKRVTRSQSKKCKELAGRSKKRLNSNVSGLGGKEGSPLKSKTVNTTESVRKIAEESLVLGELLGLKVVANKENAIKRIT